MEFEVSGNYSRRVGTEVWLFGVIKTSVVAKAAEVNKWIRESVKREEFLERNLGIRLHLGKGEEPEEPWKDSDE